MYGRFLLVLIQRVRPVSMVVLECLELLFFVLLALRGIGRRAKRYRRIAKNIDRA
jgi:hypothetical protein